ncbi:MAG: ester cyclase [Candidatus Promineifilaceae bacterium]|nr:ester cyclase [Candidatus Promineifilaceae bacterium]
MSEQNKALDRRLYTEYWNQNKVDVLDELFAADVVNHELPEGLPSGIEGTRAYLGAFLAAFPDVHMTVEKQLAEGDTVVTLWSATGTHTADLMGIPATGKEAHVTGIDVHRFEDGKIVEAWGEFDELGLMQQLGLAPAPGD